MRSIRGERADRDDVSAGLDVESVDRTCRAKGQIQGPVGIQTEQARRRGKHARNQLSVLRESHIVYNRKAGGRAEVERTICRPVKSNPHDLLYGLSVISRKLTRGDDLPVRLKDDLFHNIVEA